MLIFCLTVIQRILTADYEIDHFGQKIKYSLSIGYADSPRQGKNLAGLISRADEALYEVKLSGKSGAPGPSTIPGTPATLSAPSLALPCTISRPIFRRLC